MNYRSNVMFRVHTETKTRGSINRKTDINRLFFAELAEVAAW